MNRVLAILKRGFPGFILAGGMLFTSLAWGNGSNSMPEDLEGYTSRVVIMPTRR